MERRSTVNNRKLRRYSAIEGITTADGRQANLDRAIGEIIYHTEFLNTLNLKTFIVTLLSIASTVLSWYYGLEWNIRTDLVGIAIVFPIVFSINAAFKRREDALKCLAHIKGNAYAIRLSLHHWGEKGATPSEARQNTIDRYDDHLSVFFDTLKSYFKETGAVEGYFDEDKCLNDVMQCLSEMSILIENLRIHNVPPPEISRANQFLRDISTMFQDMKNIKIYRTPVALRAYTKFFLAIFPILFGPTFNYISQMSGELWHGITLAIVYSVILTGLDNIQEMMENPYDGQGPDDIRFDTPKAIMTTNLQVHSYSLLEKSAEVVNHA